MAKYPYQDRVIAERADLDERTSRLFEFLKDPRQSGHLEGGDRELLNSQLLAMVQLSNILGKRIERFGPEEPPTVPEPDLTVRNEAGYATDCPVCHGDGPIGGGACGGCG